MVNQEDINNKFSEFEEEFNNNPSNFTTEKEEQALEVIKKLVDSGIISDITTYSNDYDENKAKLRTGNFIESILDLDEGMTESQLFQVGVSFANEARDASLKEFPRDVMLRDAFRHFSWNNISTKSVGANKTRTATINHEWGIIMLNPMLNYFDKQYNKYNNQGYSNAGAKALGDTITYIPVFKQNAVTLCENDYSFFKGLFGDGSIMDLHNNCWGRAYATNYPSDSYRNSFYKAKNNSELILSENSVIDSNYYYVWASKWYTY